MQLVATFLRLVDRISSSMTRPTRTSFATILTGWVFAARRTITGCVVAAEAVGHKHISSFHRVYSSARWLLDRVGLAVLDLALSRSPAEETATLVVDDVHLRKRGLKMFGTGMDYDPLVSTRSCRVLTFGLTWVVLAVVVRFPFASRRPFALPFLFRLSFTQASARKWGRVFRSKPQLALDMLKVVHKHRPDRRFHAVGDTTYGGAQMLKGLPKGMHLTSRLMPNANLYAPPPPRRTGQAGRPPVRGPLLGSVSELLPTKKTGEERTLSMYGRHETVRLVEMHARLSDSPRPVKVLLQKPTERGRKAQAFFTTDTDLTAQQTVSLAADRWSIEEANRGGKNLLGFAEPQGWSRKAVERTGPVAMLLYSLILLWFADHGILDYREVERPWYRQKRTPSFADMLTTLRLASLRETLFGRGLDGEGVAKTLAPLLLAS